MIIKIRCREGFEFDYNRDIFQEIVIFYNQLQLILVLTKNLKIKYIFQLNCQVFTFCEKMYLDSSSKLF